MTKTLFLMIMVMIALSTFLVDATPVQVLGDDATPVQDLVESSMKQPGWSRVKRSASCGWQRCGCGSYGCSWCCV